MPSMASIRPWTPAAAMEPVGPAEPAPGRGAGLAWLPSVLAGVVLLTAAGVVVAVRVDPGRVAPPGLAVTALAPLPPAGGSGLATGRYPAGTVAVDLDLDYRGAVTGDSLTLRVSEAPQGGGTAHDLPPLSIGFAAGDPAAGRRILQLAPPGGAPYPPGTYTVRAEVGGRQVWVTSFVIEP